MMSFPALLDACVLLPYQLCDLLLRLAEADMYRPLWSEEILAEVERNLATAFAKTPQQAHRRVAQMRTAFPVATVRRYEQLTSTMTNHPSQGSPRACRCGPRRCGRHRDGKHQGLSTLCAGAL